MPDGWKHALGAGALVALLVGALVAPSVALGVPGAGQSCPDTTPAPAAPGSTAAVCGESKGPVGDTGGSLDISGLLPIIAATVGGAALALVAAFIVLRRRTGGPVVPADPGEWWTCRNCGRNNVIGSPRCYACGEWQG